ncbi:hypothetical protein ACFGVS_00695 [Mucilaginibacter sp. AW1-7]|uniref:hypothetical protein n=1 Tax=Mucilaginibacter sp. AW1-7 TaxID=3349874 RepID=UPI003F73FD76
MPRKKIENRDEILEHNLIVRVNSKLLKKLEDLQKNSNCQSIGEVARKILSKEKILCFYKDISMNDSIELSKQGFKPVIICWLSAMML